MSTQVCNSMTSHEQALLCFYLWRSTVWRKSEGSMACQKAVSHFCQGIQRSAKIACLGEANHTNLSKNESPVGCRPQGIFSWIGNYQPPTISIAIFSHFIRFSGWCLTVLISFSTSSKAHPFFHRRVGSFPVLCE